MCGPKYGPKLRKPLRREKNKNGQTRSPNSIVFEEREASTSLIRRMKNSKKSFRMRGESWKCILTRLCRAKREQKARPAHWKLERGLMHPTRFQKRSIACKVEAHESTRQRVEPPLLKHHEDHIAGKGYNSMSHKNLAHKFISYASSNENSGCEGSSGQGMEEARSMAPGQSQEQKEGYL